MTLTVKMTFYSELEARQRESRLFVESIGDVVRRHLVQGLDVYRVYCSNQPNAARTLHELKTHDPAVAAALGASSIDGLSLEPYLLQVCFSPDPSRR